MMLPTCFRSKVYNTNSNLNIYKKKMLITIHIRLITNIRMKCSTRQAASNTYQHLAAPGST